MKALKILPALLCFLAFAAQAQTPEQQKQYSAQVGVGYFRPVISATDVSYAAAEFSPEIGFGVSYFISLDYALSNNLYVGVGYNGNYGKARFIKNATINGEKINGYLDAGALENNNILLNVTYWPAKTGLQPYARLGVGFFMAELELGDIPLHLTDNVEKELFPDYKSRGIGILPELGIKYNNITLSAGYGLPLNELTSEKPSEQEAFSSTGNIKSHSLQINAAYRFFLF